MASQTAIRLSKEAQELLRQLSEQNDTSQPALMAMLIRDRARLEGLLPPFIRSDTEAVGKMPTSKRSGAADVGKMMTSTNSESLKHETPLKSDDGVEIKAPVTPKGIARRMETPKERFSREMSEAKQAGEIRTNGKNGVK